MTPAFVTIHDTANINRGADAVMHGRYLKGDAAANAPVSWHFTVDDRRAVQHLPLTENGWHCGDGGEGPGNRTSIGIEICENSDGDRARAEANAAELVAYLIKTVPSLKPFPECVVQHNHWNGKDCPRVLRHRPGGWEGFLDAVENFLKPVGTPIMGRSVATAHQLRQLLRKRNPDAPDYAQDYLDIGARYGVRGDIAFCQSIHETGAWRFGGQVLPEQNNFAGLGATNGGPRGASFATPQLGIEAQIQHLYLYASDDPLPAGVALVDPRWDAAVSKWGRGAAPNVEDLAGKWAYPGYDPKKFGSYAEAFAAGATYGQSILKLLTEALTYPAAPETSAPVADSEKEELRSKLAAAQAEIESLKNKIARAKEDLA